MDEEYDNEIDEDDIYQQYKDNKAMEYDPTKEEQNRIIMGNIRLSIINEFKKLNGD